MGQVQLGHAAMAVVARRRAGMTVMMTSGSVSGGERDVRAEDEEVERLRPAGMGEERDVRRALRSDR